MLSGTGARWRHLRPTLSSIKTMTISGIHSGSSHAEKQRGTVMAKTGLIWSCQWPQTRWRSPTPSAEQTKCLVSLPPSPWLCQTPSRARSREIRSALGRPMTHLKDTTPSTDHPHPWYPRMRKRDPHARLLTNAAFRWSLDPHPHQTETFPVHPGAIYSQCPTWTFPLSVNYVSEKTTQQSHARVETVYAINVIREGTSPEHVSYRTRGLAASPLQRESFQWIF